MEFVPAETLRWFVTALGAALFASALAVFAAEFRRRRDPERQRPNWIVVGVNLSCGGAMLIWGLATLLAT